MLFLFIFYKIVIIFVIFRNIQMYIGVLANIRGCFKYIRSAKGCTYYKYSSFLISTIWTTFYFSLYLVRSPALTLSTVFQLFPFPQYIFAEPVPSQLEFLYMFVTGVLMCIFCYIIIKICMATNLYSVPFCTMAWIFNYIYI